MKNFKRYINEELSSESVKKLKQYINDSDVDRVIQFAKTYMTLKNVDNEKAEKFFKKHGLANLNWGLKNTAVKQFGNLFAGSGKTDIFNEIIKNDGVVSINEMQSYGNIFSDLCKGWEDEAKVIASWTNSRSAAAGPGEILLRLLLNEATSGDKGDIALTGNKEMEVKACTISKTSQMSGGHPVGQLRTRGAWAIYNFLNKYLLEIDSSEVVADKCAYCQNKTGFNDFNNKLIKSKSFKNNDIDEIAKTLVNAICFQYYFIEHINDGNNESVNNFPADKLKVLYYETKKLLKQHMTNEGIDNFNSFLDIIGCLQVNCYAEQEKFNYFLVFLFNKDIELVDSDKNGFYIVFKDCDNENSELLFFDNLLNYLKFNVLDNPQTNQGRTGKITFKLENI